MINVAGVLVIQNGSYVLQHRDDRPDIAEPGTYSLWGGTMEHEESASEGAARELKEETGVIVKPVEFKELLNFETIGNGPLSKGKPVMVHLFTIELTPDKLIICREGQGIIRLPIRSVFPPKVNELASKAIMAYETSS